MTKGRTIEFHEVDLPITAPVTKFGGQPVWVDTPQWPLSRETGNPMRFIGQVALDDFAGAEGRVAYLFMTEEEDGEFVDGTYEPDGGENAVLVQPGATEIPCRAQATGPTLYRMVEKAGHDRLQKEPCEFSVTLLDGCKEDDPDEGVEECKIGGTPVFMQGEEYPDGEGWQLLLQLDSCSTPFYVNFGDAGVGYAFLDSAGQRGKFLWQCA